MSLHRLINCSRVWHCCIRPLVCVSVSEFVVRGVNFEEQARSVEGEEWYFAQYIITRLGHLETCCSLELILNATN